MTPNPAGPRRSPRPALGPRRAGVARRLGGLLVAAAGLCLVGCVERTLLFTSDPVGAHVTVNGKDIGLTPASLSFVHNQRFEYRVEKDGYRSVAGEVTTASTFDSLPGPDFFAENLYPGHVKRRTVRHVVLDPLARSRPRAELEQQLRDAEAFRARAESETGGPDVPPPTRRDRPKPLQPAPAAPQGAPPASR